MFDVSKVNLIVFSVVAECQRGGFFMRERGRGVHPQPDGACTEEGVFGHEELHSGAAGDGGRERETGKRRLFSANN